jgi:NTP pyrophosphatase (non-canonical NTP hydrolase)
MNTNNENTGFANALEQLEKRALQIQMEHFKIPPEKRGRAFYSLELVGEMGELLNDCKKFMRTKLAHRRAEQIEKRIPEETADTLIALILIKLAAHDEQKIFPNSPINLDDSIKTTMWLHTCLSSLALSASSLYVKEILETAVEDTKKSLDIGLYKSVVDSLLNVANFFEFDLEDATNNKLTQIITKVENGHYD